MFGEDDSESPRRPSPWQALSKSPSHSAPPPISFSTSSLTRRASYLERLAIETSSGSGLGTSCDGGFGDNRSGALALSAEAEVLRMEATGWTEESLAPEVDEVGHIEYKLKIIAPSHSRFQKLTTQMKWRLLEGGGTALYEVGVLDDGALVGLSHEDMSESLSNLERMATELGAQIRVSKVVQLPEIMIKTGPLTPVEEVPPKPKQKTASDAWQHRPVVSKKKKKSNSKASVDGISRSQAKHKVWPGDSAVSSESELEEEGPKPMLGVTLPPNLALDAPAALTSQESLASSLPAIPIPSTQPPSSSVSLKFDNSQALRQYPFDDLICPLTPEERQQLRRERRDLARLTRREETITSVAAEENQSTSTSTDISRASSVGAEVVGAVPLRSRGLLLRGSDWSRNTTPPPPGVPLAGV